MKIEIETTDASAQATHTIYFPARWKIENALLWLVKRQYLTGNQALEILRSDLLPERIVDWAGN